FGMGLAHLSYTANDADYRPILLLILLTTQLNDVIAFCVGKSLGRRKLAPNTSPGKTIGGSLGSLLLTTPLVAFLGHHVFRAHPAHRPGPHRLRRRPVGRPHDLLHQA